MHVTSRFRRDTMIFNPYEGSRDEVESGLCQLGRRLQGFSTWPPPSRMWGSRTQRSRDGLQTADSLLVCPMTAVVLKM